MHWPKSPNHAAALEIISRAIVEQATTCFSAPHPRIFTDLHPIALKQIRICTEINVVTPFCTKASTKKKPTLVHSFYLQQPCLGSEKVNDVTVHHITPYVPFLAQSISPPTATTAPNPPNKIFGDKL
ncbi:hypothetical protein MRX96_000765 [Rhipicephalus microplus]